MPEDTTVSRIYMDVRCSTNSIVSPILSQLYNRVANISFSNLCGIFGAVLLGFWLFCRISRECFHWIARQHLTVSRRRFLFYRFPLLWRFWYTNISGRIGYYSVSHGKCSWCRFTDPFLVRGTGPGRNTGSYKFPAVVDRTYISLPADILGVVRRESLAWSHRWFG